MSKVELQVVLTYSEIYGQRASDEEFIRRLSSFSQPAVLQFCSFMTLLLETHIRGAETDQLQHQLLFNFFPIKLALEFAGKFWAVSDHRRVVFHRRQMLILAKMAVTYCAQSGMVVMNNLHFGPILLMANDYLEHPSSHPLTGPVTTKAEMSDYIALMLTTGEYTHRLPAQAMARSKRLLVDLPKRLFPELDLDKSFRETTKLTIDQFHAFAIMSMAPFYKYRNAAWLSRQAESYLLPSHLKLPSVTSEEINSFLDLVSATPSYLANKFSDKVLLRNDFTLFREFPFVQLLANPCRKDQFTFFLPMDLEFMMEKMLAGPFWSLRKSIPNFDAVYWGPIFEAYVLDILSRASLGRNQTLVLDPRYADKPQEQVCDALLLDGDRLVMIEAKTCMMDSNSKYSGDTKAMQDKLTKALVGTPQAPKGVRQLANAVKALLSRSPTRKITGINLTGVHSCYCVTVTLDYIGGAPGVGLFLDSHFRDLVDHQSHVVSLRGHFSLNIEELEWMTGYFPLETLASVLEKWKLINPSLGTPLSAVDFGDLRWIKPAWLDADYPAVYDAASTYFAI